MKIFLRPKGYISSRFAGKESWREWSHTGIDFRTGYKKPIRAFADGVVYKVKYGDQEDIQEYRSVYQICETPLGPMEVAYIHLDAPKAIEGFMPQGSLIGLSGNSGEWVFSGGVKVDPADKPSGKGAHLHASVRPVSKSLKIEPGEHYLRKLNGRRYKDQDGNYYRITNKDNGSRGWVDFQGWLYTPTRRQLIAMIGKILGWLSYKVDELKK